MSREIDRLPSSQGMGDEAEKLLRNGFFDRTRTDCMLWVLGKIHNNFKGTTEEWGSRLWRNFADYKREYIGTAAREGRKEVTELAIAVDKYTLEDFSIFIDDSLQKWSDNALKLPPARESLESFVKRAKMTVFFSRVKKATEKALELEHQNPR